MYLNKYMKASNTTKDNNKSMDFTMTFKSDFSLGVKKNQKGGREGASNTRQNNRPKETGLDNNILQAQYSFSNILQDNPATLKKNASDGFYLQVNQAMESVLPYESKILCESSQ